MELVPKDVFSKVPQNDQWESFHAGLPVHTGDISTKQLFLFLFNEVFFFSSILTAMAEFASGMYYNSTDQGPS